MRRWLSTLLTGAMLAAIVAAPAVAAPPPQMSIAEIVGDGTFDDEPFDFDILASALAATGLDAALEDGGLPYDVTVFAPTDNAFRKHVRDLTGKWIMSEEKVFEVVASLGTDAIADVLLYHVVEGEVFSESVPELTGVPIPTLNGATFELYRGRGFFIMDNDPDLPDPRLVGTALDIDASNGVIHVISNVMVPADI